MLKLKFQNPYAALCRKLILANFSSHSLYLWTNDIKHFSARINLAAKKHVCLMAMFSIFWELQSQKADVLKHVQDSKAYLPSKFNFFCSINTNCPHQRKCLLCHLHKNNANPFVMISLRRKRNCFLQYLKDELFYSTSLAEAVNS